jgi:ubiquinone/menaquinone biosynthesis C-methylase UbiE
MIARPAGDTVELIAGLFSPLLGRRMLDIGCGGGHLLRDLSERGARVAGIDTDEVAVEAARQAVPAAHIQKANARNLPFNDATMHVAVFLNSLHHLPLEDMTPALAEPARVVGKGGSIVVVEPLSEGTFFEALRLIEDETEVRQAAQQAIGRALRTNMLSEARRLEYERIEAFTDAAAFVERAVATDPLRRQRAREALQKLLARFETLSERNDRGYVLRQPLRLQHLKVPVSPHPVIHPVTFG